MNIQIFRHSHGIHQAPKNDIFFFLNQALGVVQNIAQRYPCNPFLV